MEELKNIKILYIDDEESVRKNATEYLSFYSDLVYEAVDGIDGYEKYLSLSPDIIITDIKMPRLNGLDMVKRIRKKDKDTKIIIATAFLDTKYLLEAISLGLVKYIIKPVTEETLLPSLKECIQTSDDKSNIIILHNGFKYDIFNKTLFDEQVQIHLNKKEMILLNLIVKNHNRAVKYDEINSHVWHGEMSDGALRSVIKDLRNKLSKETIKNVSGIGYQIVLKEQQ